MKYLLLALVTLSGATIPLQIAANKRLFESVKSPVLTVALILTLGAVLSWIISFSIPAARGELAGAMAAPWWAWLAVVLIVFAIAIQVINAEQEGAGPLIALIVGGQLVCAMLIDHFGALGMERDPIRWWKVAGALAMVGGAAVMQIKGK